jgi:hypothetical protein
MSIPSTEGGPITLAMLDEIEKNLPPRVNPYNLAEYCTALLWWLSEWHR